MSKKALRRDEFLRHLLWISVLAVGIVLLVHGTVPRSAPTGTV